MASKHSHETSVAKEVKRKVARRWVEGTERSGHIRRLWKPML